MASKGFDLPSTENPCINCLNAGTPICDGCSFIQKPSGKKSKPTQYAGALGTNKDNKRMAALASSIALRIQTGNPVPVRWLLEYNKLVTDDGGEG